MTEFRELKESPSKEKSLNTKKLPSMIESQLKELSLTIMLSKLKSNIFLKKLKKLLLNMNQLKGLGKEFNIYLLKLRLFTILNVKDMLLDLDNIILLELMLFLEEVILYLGVDILLVDKQSIPLEDNQAMFLEVTLPEDTPQVDIQLYLLEDILLANTQSIPLEDQASMVLNQELMEDNPVTQDNPVMQDNLVMEDKL